MFYRENYRCFIILSFITSLFRKYEKSSVVICIVFNTFLNYRNTKNFCCFFTRYTCYTIIPQTLDSLYTTGGVRSWDNF